MKTLINDSIDPAYNLALEEYLLKEYNFDEDILLIWRNDKSVILGRNQNPWNEVNLRFTEDNSIPVLRRISGGGTVVHDLGNINFSFILNSSKHINDYLYFLDPIIKVLNSTGLNARFEPKSHIYVNDHKISGNAQALYKGKMIHHGTLLYDSNLEFLSKCIKKKPTIKGHFVESNRAIIRNINELLLVGSTVEEFIDFLRNELLHNDILNKLFELNNSDIVRINQIKKEKYLSYDWNFGKSFEIKQKIELRVHNGIVIKSSVDNLVGKKFLPGEVKNLMDDETFHKIF